MKAKFIYETLNFERKQDKMSSLGVGQIHFIKSWLDEMEVKNYIINDDLTIDVNDHVDLFSKNLDKFPIFIKFNKVKGYFYCSNNNLTSLEGCPTSVGRGFYCFNNNLTNLEGCPTSVGGNFSCHDNKKQFTKYEVRKFCKVDEDIII